MLTSYSFILVTFFTVLLSSAGSINALPSTVPSTVQHTTVTESKSSHKRHKASTIYSPGVPQPASHGSPGGVAAYNMHGKAASPRGGGVSKTTEEIEEEVIEERKGHNNGGNNTPRGGPMGHVAASSVDRGYEAYPLEEDSIQHATMNSAKSRKKRSNRKNSMADSYDSEFSSNSHANTNGYYSMGQSAGVESGHVYDNGGYDNGHGRHNYSNAPQASSQSYESEEYQRQQQEEYERQQQEEYQRQQEYQQQQWLAQQSLNNQQGWWNQQFQQQSIGYQPGFQSHAPQYGVDGIYANTWRTGGAERASRETASGYYVPRYSTQNNY